MDTMTTKKATRPTRRETRMTNKKGDNTMTNKNGDNKGDKRKQKGDKTDTMTTKKGDKTGEKGRQKGDKTDTVTNNKKQEGRQRETSRTEGGHALPQQGGHS